MGVSISRQKTDGRFAFSIAPKNLQESVINAFAQDEIALGQRVRVTLGGKVERDTFAGWGLQPTARVMWTLVPKQQHLWAAISRALHTPSLGDVSGRYNFASFIGQGGLPVVVGALGNPDYQPEEILNAETGYRLEIGSVASIDVTAFVGELRQAEDQRAAGAADGIYAGPAHLLIPVQFGNLLEATTTGMEIAARWAPANWWRLEGGYSAFRFTPHLSPASRDTAAATFDGNAPRAQWKARSAFSITPHVQVDAMLFHTGALSRLGIEASITRADVRLEVRLHRQLSASMVGQNLLDPHHAEYAGTGAVVSATEIPRSAQVQLRWRFRITHTSLHLHFVRQQARMVIAVGVLLMTGQHLADAQQAIPRRDGCVRANFAKFTEWPLEVLPRSTPLVLCVAGAPKVLKALEKVTEGRAVEGRLLVVREIELAGPLRSCHLLYAGGLDARSGAKLMESLRGASILALSNLDQFSLMGGTANVFVEESRMRFAVNLDAMQRAKLRLSSRLLALAKIVKEA